MDFLSAGARKRETKNPRQGGGVGRADARPIEAVARSGKVTWEYCTSVLKVVQCDTTNLNLVGFFKALLKLAVLVLLGAAVAGVVVMVKRPQLSGPTSFEEWPDVPTNTAS